jgi:hypothetical protein
MYTWRHGQYCGRKILPTQFVWKRHIYHISSPHRHACLDGEILYIILKRWDILCYRDRDNDRDVFCLDNRIDENHKIFMTF